MHGHHGIPPSRLRAPVSIIVGVLVPPLGLIAWILLSGGHRIQYLRSNWIRGGAALMIVPALLLLAVDGLAASGLGADPNPNPIGLGLLLLAGGIAGTVLIAVGVVIVARRERQTPLARN